VFNVLEWIVVFWFSNFRWLFELLGLVEFFSFRWIVGMLGVILMGWIFEYWNWLLSMVAKYYCLLIRVPWSLEPIGLSACIYGSLMSIELLMVYWSVLAKFWGFHLIRNYIWNCIGLWIIVMWLWVLVGLVSCVYEFDSWVNLLMVEIGFTWFLDCVLWV
jgi:hypothetical protein